MNTRKSLPFRLFPLIAVLLALPGGVRATSTLTSGFQTSRTEKGMALKQFFEYLEKRSSYKFMYDEQAIQGLRTSISPDRGSVTDVLNRALANSGLSWKETEGEFISIYSSHVQQILRGIVVDPDGTPLPGVTVMVENWRNLPSGIQRLSTATDGAGHWGLEVPNADVRIVFQSLGYSSVVRSYAEIVENGRTVMEPSAGNLKEVVVIGYGTTTRKLNTGSVATVSSKTISEQPVGNVLNALQGRMAGVQVTQSNGLPGSSVNIKVRGTGSLSSGTVPLYIVDGVPFTFHNINAVPATNDLNAYGIRGASGGISPLNSINPSDIESINVLKDADATAIYGARGANGVVLITTKKGKAGRTRLDVNVTSGFGNVPNYIDMLSGEQYLALRREAFANDGVTPNETNAPDLTIWSQTEFKDWQKELIGGTAQYQDIQASLSGGNEFTNFVFQPSWHKETTVFPGEQGQDRFSGRMHVNHKSADNKFNASLSTIYSEENTNLSSADLSSFHTLAPNYPTHNPDGSLYFFRNIVNPYTSLMQPYDGNTKHLNANGTLRYIIMPGLEAKTSLGYATMRLSQNRKLPISSMNNITPVGTLESTSQFADNSSSSYIIEPQLTYKKRLDDHSFDVLLGGTIQESKTTGSTAVGIGYANPALMGILSAATRVTAGNSFDQYRYVSLFGRLSYQFKERYLLNATLRRDGSSRFGPNNRYGTFGAVGLGWVFSSEEFFKDALPFVSFGKLRTSYGVTGNDQITNYQYLSTYTTGGTSSAYGGTVIQYPSRLANPGIQWEETKKFEAALELGFLDDKVLVQAAHYRNRSSNQLVYIPVAGQIGFSDYYGNFDATIENTGWEFGVNSTNIRNENFNWTTDFNLTFVNTRITEFKDLETSAFYRNTYFVGYPPDVRRLYRYNGVNPENGAAMYVTQNENGIPSFGTDQYPGEVGTPWYGGITNTFTYKQFDFGFFFQFNSQYSMTNQLYVDNIFRSLGGMLNQNTSVEDRWRQPGDVGTLFPGATANPGAVANSYAYIHSASDQFWKRNLWLKLRNVNLGYRLSPEIASKLKLRNVRIFAQAQNLWTQTKMQHVYDPETGSALPALRTIVFGVNLSL